MNNIEKIWQDLHAIPEPAFKEIKTSQYLATYLRKLGYQVQDGLTPSHTGILATLDSGKKGPLVGLRSDMDCLMFAENNKEVPIHACGHDGHMSMVLAAAEALAQSPLKKGQVKIVFQPAEEIGLGAKAMLSTGLLDDLDYLFGVHLMPKELAKSGQVAAQVNWMACTLITAEITGLSAHGSMPHLGISALDTGCAIVNAINAIHLNPLEGWSVKATRFNTGTGAINAICDHAEISFDLRTTFNSSMEELKTKVATVIKATAKAYGAKVKIKEIGDCPGTEADPTVLTMIKKVILTEMGQAGLIPEVTTTVGEDFNFYKKFRPNLKTGFIGLGCDLEPCLHDRNMHFDHSQLLHGAHILTALVQAALETK